MNPGIVPVPLPAPKLSGVQLGFILSAGAALAAFAFVRMNYPDEMLIQVAAAIIAFVVAHIVWSKYGGK